MAKTNGKSSSPRLDKLVNYYIKLRTEIEDIKKQHEAELAKHLKAREVLTEQLLEALDSTGQEMARTKFGTVSAAVRDTASCSDPALFIDYVRKNDAYELVERRPNSTACREFAKGNDGKWPPGVKVNSIRYVNVRSPAQKEDII